VSETDVSSPAGPPPRRWGKWLLIASLALNLAVVGAVAARFIMGPPHMRGWGPPPADMGLMWFSRHLPAGSKKMVRDNLKAARPEFRTLRDNVTDQRRIAADTLAAEPFDREAAKAALDKVGAIEAQLREKGVDVLLNTAGKLTPDERKLLADKWKKRLDKPRKRDRDGGPE
jgi:uncharacterized membrane protein